VARIRIQIMEYAKAVGFLIEETSNYIDSYTHVGSERGEFKYSLQVDARTDRGRLISLSSELVHLPTYISLLYGAYKGLFYPKAGPYIYTCTHLLVVFEIPHMHVRKSLRQINSHPFPPIPVGSSSRDSLRLELSPSRLSSRRSHDNN